MMRALVSELLIICAIILEVPGLALCYCAGFLADLAKSKGDLYTTYFFEKLFQRISLFLDGPFHIAIREDEDLI